MVVTFAITRDLSDLTSDSTLAEPLGGLVVALLGSSVGSAHQSLRDLRVGHARSSNRYRGSHVVALQQLLSAPPLIRR